MTATAEQQLAAHMIANIAVQLDAGTRPQDIVEELTAQGLPEEAVIMMIDAAQKAMSGRSRKTGIKLIIQGVLAGGLGLGLTIAASGHAIFHGLLAIGFALTVTGAIVLATGKSKILGLKLH